MPSYVFPGFPRFVESAAAELGLLNSARPVRRLTALTDLANLCAQAAHGDPSRVDAILAKAAEFRDQLAIALRAADLMLADVEMGRRPSTFPVTQAEVEDDEASISALVPRSGRKATRNERISS